MAIRANFSLKLVMLVAFTVFISCKQKGQLHRPSSFLEDKVEIKACLTNMWDAIERNDIEKYASYVHPDFTQFGESDPVLRIGKETEIAGIANWLNNSSNIHTEMEDPRIEIRGDVAWITYYWKDHGITNEQPFSSRGKSTRIFVKEEGNWLCIHGHYTLL